ncbi:MAG: hypothetical protein ACRC20_17620 [Segniliparus sp.]|uniref:hypothetical protein n=1 Tax=Segniliparus sp. TaxID=2804064 RepID=UPI003F3B57B8
MVSVFRSAVVASGAALAAVALPGVAEAAGAQVGDSCPTWHATTHDSAGKTMWCNHTMTGGQILVWQYGGPD